MWYKMIKKHSPEEARKRLKDMLDSKGLFRAVDAQFGTVKGKPKNFLPHKIQQKLPTVRDAVYTFPEDKKPKFLRKKTSGSA